MIISVVQTKGGTGKSTLSVSLAFSQTMSKQFGSIALIELDPQGTLQDWWKERDAMGLGSERYSLHHISSTQKGVLENMIHSIRSQNELIIIDTPGESSGKLHTKLACALADLVLIPIRSSTNDELAFANKLLPLLKDILKLDSGKRNAFYVVPAFVHPRASKEKILAYYEEILPPFVQCLPAMFPMRSVYENFNRDGGTLGDFLELVSGNKRDYQQVQKAVEDVETLAQAVLERG